MFPKNDLPRIPDHWKTFGARISPLTGSPRLAANPVNAILNYLYALLESEARLAAAVVGLDPGLGVMHADQPNRDNLACDLMEPARPKVDWYLLDLLLSQPLKREWFFEERNGNCRLMPALAERLSETLPTWKRAVGPLTEWTAQTLWKYARQKTVRSYELPTRLTERRRTEGRDRIFQPKEKPIPKPERACKRCGGQVGNKQHCASCGAAIATEALIEGAKRGREISHAQEAVAQIAKTQTQQRRAIAAWSKLALPTWLTLNFYRSEIQPRLRSIPALLIAEELGVSQTYVFRLRGGTQRPHPRHWLALAKLTGAHHRDS